MPISSVFSNMARKQVPAICLVADMLLQTGFSGLASAAAPQPSLPDIVFEFPSLSIKRIPEDVLRIKVNCFLYKGAGWVPDVVAEKVFTPLATTAGREVTSGPFTVDVRLNANVDAKAFKRWQCNLVAVNSKGSSSAINTGNCNYDSTRWFCADSRYPLATSATGNIPSDK
jgi:hypothetical protein